MRTRKSFFIGNHQGFTLVELMITLAMSAIIVAAVYSAYIIQQKTYYTQGQVVEMQQNIRAGLELMSSEIRMAGYDPGGKAGASVTAATATKFAFTANLNAESGDTDLLDTNENVTFCLDATGADIDGDGCDDNGIADTGAASIVRSNQPIADDIQRIEFFYTLDDGVTKTLNPTAAQLPQIQTVQITMLAVSSQRDPKYTNTESYTTGSGVPWPGPLSTDRFNDNFRRRLLTSSVNVRNQGLN
jgi:type IV pilus assembly protein PilW